MSIRWLPLVFVELGEVAVHVTDTVLLAHVGQAELGAVALGDVVLELAVVPAIGLVEAVQIAVARRAGQDRFVDLRRAFFRGMVLIGIVSTAAAVSIALLAPALATGLAGGAGVADRLAAFLRIAAVGSIFETASLGLSALCVGLPGAWGALGLAWLVGLRPARTWVDKGRWRSRLV